MSRAFVCVESQAARATCLSTLGAYSSTFHPDWSVLAARIAVSNLHKETEASFSKNCETLHRYRHPKASRAGVSCRSGAS